MLKGVFIGGYYVPDLYQRYSTYFLNDSDCELLKTKTIIKVVYQLDDKSERLPRLMTFVNNGFSLQDQLTAIGK